MNYFRLSSKKILALLLFGLTIASSAHFMGASVNERFRSGFFIWWTELRTAIEEQKPFVELMLDCGGDVERELFLGVGYFQRKLDVDADVNHELALISQYEQGWRWNLYHHIASRLMLYYVTGGHKLDLSGLGPELSIILPILAVYVHYYARMPLRSLNLSHNELEGPVPACIAEWFPNLVELDLSGNHLRGSLAILARSLPNLERLHIRGNNFSKLSNHFAAVVGPRERPLTIVGMSEQFSRQTSLGTTHQPAPANNRKRSVEHEDDQHDIDELRQQEKAQLDQLVIELARTVVSLNDRLKKQLLDTMPLLLMEQIVRAIPSRLLVPNPDGTMALSPTLLNSVEDLKIVFRGMSSAALTQLQEYINQQTDLSAVLENFNPFL